MMGTDWERSESVAVAVALDRDETKLIRSAATVARRLNKRLRLLHVIEPWESNFSSLTLAGSSPLWSVANEVRAAGCSSAKKKMNELATTIESSHGITVESELYEGDPVQWLPVSSERDAILIVGSDQTRKGLAGRFSTAAKIAGKCQTTVLVCPLDQDLTDKSKIRILLCDDLQPQTSTAAEMAFSYASAWENVEILHLHVTGLTLDGLRVGIDTACAASRLPQSSMPSVPELYGQIVAQFENQLKDRAGPWLERLQSARCSYRSHVGSGVPLDEIARVREEFAPTLEVYGRHRMFHTKPFAFGRVPFSGMLSGQSLVMVTA